MDHQSTSPDQPAIDHVAIHHNLVTYKELAKILGVSERTVRAHWREYPAVFPTNKRHLSTARFIPNDVIEHLKARDYDFVKQPRKARNRHTPIKRTKSSPPVNKLRPNHPHGDRYNLLSALEE